LFVCGAAWRRHCCKHCRKEHADESAQYVLSE
jgi:hypothetical protein